ncbi:MAG TPA: acyl-CoA dehydrogenase family protein [Sphingobium sp.]|nr:acyl-CoA dehydrogenase family protein [Sphingobium sp.]
MSIDRAELQDAAAKAFGEAGIGADPARIWELIADMGWLSMTVPEELGGLGLGRVAQGVIHTELGRVLAPGPVMAHMLVIEALTAADGMAERQALLEQAMAGALMTSSLVFATAACTEGADGALTLSGTLGAVPDADKASRLLLFSEDRTLCLLLPLDAASVSIAQRATWDESRRLFDVTLDATPADASMVLARGEAAVALADRLTANLLVALAADSLGGAEAMLDITIEYLKTRRQFDRPLALFQALKHRCADMKTVLAAADALFWLQAEEEAATSPEATIGAGALKARAARVYQFVTEEAIQLHGGIGLTEEHQCHLFMKRAMLNATLGGGADAWEEKAGRLLLGRLLEVA